MPKKFDIRVATEDDLDRILALHHVAFVHLQPKELFGFGESNLRELVDDGTVIVAIKGGRVVGYGSYHRMDKYDGVYQNFVDTLNDTRDPSTYDDWVNHYAERREEIGRGEVVVKRGKNPFTREEFPINSHDVVLHSMVVEEDERGQKIGRVLARRRLEIAQGTDATAIYVSCAGNSPSRSIYKKNGFETIVEAGPTLLDGSSAHFMGYLL